MSKLLEEDSRKFLFCKVEKAFTGLSMWKCPVCQTENWDSATVCHNCSPDEYSIEIRGQQPSPAPETPQETENDELEPIDKLLLAVVIESAEVIDNLAEKSDENPRVFMESCRNLNPGAISRRSTRALDDIERYVRANISELLNGWLTFVGKNSNQTEQAFLIGELADAFSDVGNAVETLKEDIITKMRLKFSEILTSAA